MREREREKRERERGARARGGEEGVSAWPRVWRDSAPRELGPVVLGKGLRTEPRAISPGPSAVERSPSVGFLNLRTSSGVYMAAGPVFSSPSPLLARSHCPPGHQRSGLWKPTAIWDSRGLPQNFRNISEERTTSSFTSACVLGTDGHNVVIGRYNCLSLAT